MLWYQHSQVAYENWANSWGKWRCTGSELSLPLAKSAQRTGCCSAALTCSLERWLELLMQVSLHQDDPKQLRETPIFHFADCTHKWWAEAGESKQLKESISEKRWNKIHQKLFVRALNLATPKHVPHILVKTIGLSQWFWLLREPRANTSPLCDAEY